MPPIDRDAKIPCPTPQHLQIELDALAAVLELREQEDTWEKMERGIIRFTGVTKGGGYKHLPLFIEGVGKMGVGLKVGQCMLSDRGRLSGVATELLQTLAPRLGPAFQPLVPVYLPPLVQLLGRPNKVFLKRAEKCLWTIISNCHLSNILLELRRGLSDEAATCRRGCAAGFERALVEWQRGVFGEKGVGIVEEALRKVGTDKDPEVRATGKRIWTRFSEVWPERVDEFSGPLTPTIRRYLGVSAAAATAVAGSSKSRAAPARAAPTRPTPFALTASTSSAPVATPAPSPPLVQMPPPPPVQMAPPPPPPQTAAPPELVRPLTFPTRATRPALPTSQSEACLPTQPPIEAVRPRRSPTKVLFPGGPAIPGPPVLEESTRPRILSSRAPRYPPGVLGAHTRSVSHSVLPPPEVPSFPFPSEWAPTPVTSAPEPPTRPALPTSFSTTSLPTSAAEDEGRGTWQPARRFAGGPLRAALPSSAEERMPISGSVSAGATPHVLRGAVRPAPVPVARRDLGQPQRRVISNPVHPALASSASIPDFEHPIPASTQPQISAAPALLRVSTSVRDRIQEMERKASEAEVEAAGVPLPSSPVAERFANGQAGTRSREGTPTRRRVELAALSPSVPMLARSLRGSSGPEKGMLRDEEAPSEVGDMTLSESTATKESEPASSNSADSVDPPALRTAPATFIEMGTVAVTDTTALPPPPPTTAASTSEIAPSTLASKKAASTAPAPAGTAPPAPEAKPRKPPIPQPAPRVRAEKPTAAAERLPPITAVRATKPRLPQAEARRPFRPTTKAAAPPAAATTAAPPVKAAVSSRSASGSTAPKGPAVAVPKAAPAPVPKPTAPPVPASRSVSSNLTKPTAASAQRAASATHPPASSTTTAAAAAAKGAAAAKASSSASSTLPPPVKKDKVKRKAAVPAFRPTRTADPKSGGAPTARAAATPAAAGGTTSLSASTISSAPSSSALGRSQAKASGLGVGAGGIVAKVRVKPEAIPLPISPGEKRAVEIPLPPSPVVLEFTGKVKVRTRPESLGLSTSGREAGGGGAIIGTTDGRGDRVSPLASEVPLPLSPTASSTTPVSSPPRPTVEFGSSSSQSPINLVNISHSSPSRNAVSTDLGLPCIPGSGLTPISKASTIPARSDWMGSDSEDEEASEAGEERVTLGKNRQEEAVCVPPVDSDGAEKDLIEFSSPSRPTSDPAVKVAEAEETGLTELEKAEERDLIEFSAPSRPALSVLEGDENTVGRSEVSPVSQGKTMKAESAAGGVVGTVASPRVVLSERRNGVLRHEELL